MKKTIPILFILCFCSIKAFSQIYHLEYSSTLSLPCPGTSCVFTVNYNNSDFTVYDVSNNEITPIDGNSNYNVRPAKIEHSRSYSYTNCDSGSDGGFYDDFCSASDQVVIPSSGFCVSASSTHITAKLSVALETLSQPTDNTFCNNGTFSLGAHNDCNNYRYRWRYSTNGTSFSNVSLTTFGSSNSNKNLSDFLPSGYTGNLFVKAQISYDNGSSYTDETNIITYTIISCSPQLTSFTSLDTQCSYSSDGGFTAHFDRDLNAGETFIMTLYRVEGANEILINQESTTILNTGNTYNWPLPQPAATYLVKYQTENGGTFSSLETSGQFTIGNPPPAIFSANKANDVYCFGGSDGQINLTASGGVGNFEYQVNGGAWAAFSGVGSHPITGLSAGTYTIKVRDGNACTERLGDGSDKTVSITLTQPTEAISISLVNLQNTTANGFTNGSITVDVDGGTPFGDGSYTFEWRDSSNTIVSSTTTQNVATGYRITLNDIGANTYTLTITDANYGSATTQTNCTFMDTYMVTEPPILNLSIQETNPISCNSSNAFGNPDSDGELTAIASGGVPFDPLIGGFYEYVYTWKKKNTGGVWQIIAGETTDVLSNINAGEYAVNIEDANGIIIGTYTNNVLTTANDAEYTLIEPDLLQVNLSKTDVYCHNGSDGTIQATITGGTGDYTVFWNTGATTQNLDNLVVGTYTISVTDEKGCEAEASIEITQPDNPIEINYTFFAPTFTGATNGWIKATVTGGTPLVDGSYTFLWEDGSNTNLVAQVTSVINATNYELTLNNLGEGNYHLTIEDSNYLLATDNANCTIVESDYFLEDPEPLITTIAVQTPISCNSVNTYGDPSNDGALVATAEGGVQLQPTDNNGLLYYYTWKKETSLGVWTVLTSQTTDVASGLDTGNYAVNVEDANGIIIGIYVNNILVNATDVTFSFEEPSLLELSITKQDVYCHLGSDGWAEVTITGGTPPYTTTWSNGDTSLLTENLSEGTYTVAITDSRGCQVEGSIDILQPNDPLQIDYTAFSRPTTNGASDGWIEAQIIGGTALADGNNYTYTWTDSAGTSLNTQTMTSFEGLGNDIFQIRLNDIPSGVYSLTIEDANYPNASTQDGCTIIENEFIVYEPIEATIEVFLPISCNQNNTFDNPFSDGQLLATVTGGLPFTTVEPYIYHWKKQDATGVYVDLLSQTSNIAIDLSTGNYALNVEDSLGNVIGIYDSFTLVQATDVLFTFEEPDLLEVNLSSTEISCDAGNDGTATVDITGGIPPYDIEWSNADTTPTITNLIAGTYIVYIIDARGCEVIGQVTIEQPGGLEIEIVDQINPTCYLGSDGSISVNVTGGEMPYTYLWNIGETTTSISNLTEGIYTFQIIDANNCTAFLNIELIDPDPIIVDLGEDRTLCNGQVHALDITINDSGATYQWTSNNGFTSNSSIVSLTEAGVYTATLTTGLSCVGTDTIEIITSTVDIDSQLIVTSQAFAEEEIILINTSNPLSAVVEWIVPNEAQIIQETNETIILRFDVPGAYEVILRSFQGDCYQDDTKPVVVEEARDLPDIGDADAPFIVDFTPYPNPTTGEFTVDITLQEEASISLRMFSLISNLPVDDRQEHNASEYQVNYNVSLPSGIYFLLLETAKGSEIRKIIIE